MHFITTQSTYWHRHSEPCVHKTMDACVIMIMGKSFHNGFIKILTRGNDITQFTMRMYSEYEYTGCPERICTLRYLLKITKEIEFSFFFLIILSRIKTTNIHILIRCFNKKKKNDFFEEFLNSYFRICSSENVYAFIFFFTNLIYLCIFFSSKKIIEKSVKIQSRSVKMSKKIKMSSSYYTR